MGRGDYDDTGFYRDYIADEGERWRRERRAADHERNPEMRDGIRRSIQSHQRQKDAAEETKRMEGVCALAEAWRRGGISTKRALVEVIDTARGDAASVVRVGHEVRPDIQTGETR